jgi:hypothetical protein
MPLPPNSDPRWHAVLSGTTKLRFQSLALNMFLTRVRLAMLKDSSERKVAEWTQELRTLLEQNADQPAVQGDLKLMFGDAAKP